MKKVFSIIICVLLLATSAVPVLATASGGHLDVEQFVFDYADVLDSDEEAEIEAYCADLNLFGNSAMIFITMPRGSGYDEDGYSDFFMENNPSYDTDAPLYMAIFDTENASSALYTYNWNGVSLFSEEARDAMITYSYEADEGDYYTSLLKIASETVHRDELNLGIEDYPSDDYYDGYDYNDPNNAVPDDVGHNTPNSHGKRIIDDADLLTDEEETLLDTRIGQIFETYSYQVVIHTTTTFYNKKVAQYADDYYDYNGYQDDGMVLVINMNSRDYYTSTKGKGISVFTDYAIYDGDSYINKRIAPFLSKGKYYKALDIYLLNVETFLDGYNKNGEAYDNSNPAPRTFKNPFYYVSFSDFLVTEAVILAVSVAFMVFIMKKHLAKARAPQKARTAADCVVPGSVQVTGGGEYFVRKSVSKTAKASESSSSGGRSSGSSTHSSSSGSSHGGGGGKF